MKIRIKYLLLLYPLLIICIPRPSMLDDIYIHMLDVLLILYPLFVIILLFFTDKSFQLRINSRNLNILILLLIYLSWQLIVIGYWTLDTKTSANDIFQLYKPLYYICALLIGIVSVRYISMKDLIRLLIAIQIINIIVSVFQFLEIEQSFYIFCNRPKEAIIIEYIREKTIARVIGTIGNPSMFGLLEAVLTIFFFHLFNEKKKILYLFLSATALFLMIQTQSRTAFMLFFIMVFFYIFLYSKIKLSFKTITLFSLLAAIFYITIFELQTIPYLSDGIKTVLQEGLLKQNSFYARLEIWNDLFDLIKKNYMFGYGPALEYLNFSFADNNYILIVFRFGIIGLLIFISIIVLYLFYLYESVLSVRVLVSLFWILLLFSGFFMDSLESMKITPLLFLFSSFTIQKQDEVQNNSGKIK